MNDRPEVTDKLLASALLYARQMELGPFTLVTSLRLTAGEVEDLLATPGVEAVVHRDADAKERERLAGRLGDYQPPTNDWILPRKPKPLMVFVGVRQALGLRMMLAAMRRGVAEVVYWSPFGWQHKASWRIALLRIRAWIKGEIRTVWEALELHPHWLRARSRVWRGLPKPAQRLIIKWGAPWAAFFDECVADGTFSGSELAETRHRALLTHAKFPIFPPEAFNRHRIVLINSALGPGGAERQVVNTLMGFKKRGLDDSGLICFVLEDKPGADFYLHRLEDAGIEVTEAETLDLTTHGLPYDRIPLLHQVLRYFPDNIREKLVKLIGEFLKKRPEVVHAWQDETNIVVGFAACITGVPRIILGTRNVAPIHFHYFERYMRPAYRALWKLAQAGHTDSAGGNASSINFINNSAAGAEDYAAWLGIPVTAFHIVHNGIEITDFPGNNAEQGSQFRQAHGIPEDVKIIGAVFRHYQEKRPLLWADATARVAERRGDVHFVVIGDGPLQGEFRDRIEENGFADRYHLVDSEPNIAAAISLMNVFLLTSQFEGTPNVLLEAQALGVPVVATEAGGVGESLEPDVTGFLVDQANPDVIAEKLLWILEHPEWAANVAKRGPAFVSERFGIERMIDETLAVYGIKPGDSEAV